MAVAQSSIKEMLSGEKAFYNTPDYIESTSRDFSSKKALPVTYEWNTESKVGRVVRQILSIICFPIIVYRLLHELAGKIIILASTPSRINRTENYVVDTRKNIQLNGEWKYKRITIGTDGNKIDLLIFGKSETLGNGTWTLVSNGNAEFYEEKACSDGFKTFLTKTQSNAIVWNYPGVGASTGHPTRDEMAKAYQAILSFLEIELGAKKIIGLARSIGGGVQSDARAAHTFKDDVKYVFTEIQTFSTLAEEAYSLFSNKSVVLATVAQLLIQALGWNMNPAQTSKKLAVPEIILQTCKMGLVEQCRTLLPAEETKTSAPPQRRRSLTRTVAQADFRETMDHFATVRDIEDDSIISAQASLAKALLEDTECSKEQKLFLGIPEKHNDSFGETTLTTLASAINNFLIPQGA